MHSVVRSYCLLFLVAFLEIFHFVLKADAETLRLAVIGDSYSDEYKFYPQVRTNARNWIEILSKKRHVDFGSFTFSKRADSRGQGFGFNFAKDGDTTSDALVDGQAIGVASLVAANRVNAVVILIGGDDFLNALDADPSSVDGNTLARNAIQNISSIISIIESAGASPIFILTLPDIRALPVLKAGRVAGTIPQSVLDQLKTAEDAYNSHLKNLAASDSQIVIVDFAGMSQRLLSKRNIKIAGVEIAVTGTSNGYRHIFLSDGIHLGTVAQALLANEIIRTIDETLSIQIKPLTGAEIIGVALRAAQFRK